MGCRVLRSPFLASRPVTSLTIAPHTNTSRELSSGHVTPSIVSATGSSFNPTIILATILIILQFTRIYPKKWLCNDVCIIYLSLGMGGLCWKSARLTWLHALIIPRELGGSMNSCHRQGLQWYDDEKESSCSECMIVTRERERERVIESAFKIMVAHFSMHTYG